MVLINKIQRSCDYHILVLLIFLFLIVLQYYFYENQIYKLNQDVTSTVPEVRPKSNEPQDWFSNLQLPVSRARFDNTRSIRIYDFVRIGNKWENVTEKFDICLTTQTSIERLYWLSQVLETWNGPVSLAVFISTQEEWIILNLFMTYLEGCFQNFRDNVSVHVAVPVYLAALSIDAAKITKHNLRQLKISTNQKSCNDVEKRLKFLLDAFKVPTHKDKDKLALKLVYPQNHMRNIARKTCSTHWTFSTDVDIIPRPRMAEMLQEFYEHTQTNATACKKCAFVIPTFELEESKTFPKTKRELVNYFNMGAARQYHGRDYNRAQHATNYSLYEPKNRWTKTNLEEGPARISHEIMKSEKFTNFYEPFYISSDKIPAFDERFLGYGLTRSSQFQEALLAGWNFTVISPAYSIHWGLHEPQSSSSTKETVAQKIRTAQTKDNHRLFLKIIKEMKLKQAEGLL